MTRPDGTLTARPTVYRGIPMRSRLEARYAAMLDELGEEWKYEPLAFGGRGGQYLPDFALMMTGRWNWYVEVKPTIELALPFLTRMLVILESDPDAWLEVRVVDVGYWLSFPNYREWRWWRNADGWV